MKNPCDRVLEHVAVGEPLGELAEHVATCERCQQAVALPAAIATAHRPVDPGLGFSARMTAGAQHRLALRRRRRLVGTLAVTVAVGAAAVIVVTRPGASHDEPAADQAIAPSPTNPDDVRPVALDADEAAALVQLADTRRARRFHAPWARIQRPLAPYKKLVKGVRP